MTAFSQHPFDRQDRAGGPSEPLPAEFAADLQRVDGLISRQARIDQAQDSIPADLTERIFSASVDSLPQRRVLSTRAQEQVDEHSNVSRFVLWGMTRMSSRVVWGRVAMAASVALVFSIGALMMHTANPPSRRSMIVHANPNPAKPVVTLAAADTDLETLPVGSVEDLDSRVGYLQGTDDVTSFDQVRREMATLVASLDM